MAIAYFDCASGISGDMFLGALVDAGLPVARLGGAIEALGIDGLSVTAEKVKRMGLAATKVHVVAPAAKAHRGLGDIEKIIRAGALGESVKETAVRIFRRLAAAEAKVHGEPIERVHFHEVGALDSIADIVGAAAGLELLGVESCFFSPIPPGSGTVKAAHGVLPVPAPATAQILIGVPLAESEEPGELTTPTGAAIARELATGFGAMPAMTVASVGSGAGGREGVTRPNILRVFIGAARADLTPRSVFVIETAVDDMTGEEIAFALEALFEAGALDAYVTPAFMKKGRPAQVITILADEERKAAVLERLFSETSTFGARVARWGRETLDREVFAVESEWGAFRLKTGAYRGKVVSAAPEYEDARRIALDTKRPFKTVYARLEELGRAFLEKRPSNREIPE